MTRISDDQRQAVPSIVHLISQFAVENGSHVAATFAEDCITYAELDDGSSKLASELQAVGVGPEDFVPVLTCRSIEMLVCVLAVLKCSACYVPIDLDTWSDDRIQFVLKAVSARVAISTKAVKSELSCHLIQFDTFRQVCRAAVEDGAAQEDLDMSSWPNKDRLAYIIFTSGTTAAPKGVMVEHRAVLNYVQQGGPETPFNMNVRPSDIVCLLFSVAFDACAGVIFSTLCHGGRLMISSPESLAQDVVQCTLLPSTPSILATIGDPARCDKLRGIFLGGESPSPALVEQWWTPQRRLYNCYGPTETTCASLIGEMRPAQHQAGLMPMKNSQILLLDDSMNPAEEGEICISGPGLARGYYLNEKLTKEKFVMIGELRFYRTGDFAKRLCLGYKFIGRRDNLVKNRGFLVNLDVQVIAVLRSYDGVQAATAFKHKDHLVAFVSPILPNVQSIRRNLFSKIDSFAIPDRIETVAEMPLTFNGKIDQRALEKILDERAALPQDPGMEDDGSDQVMRALRKALSQVLHRPLRVIDEDNSFWDLGGNSLIGIRLCAILQSNNLAITLTDLFGAKNIRSIRGLIRPKEVDSASNVSRLSVIASGDEVSDAPAEVDYPITASQLQMIRSTIARPPTNYLLTTIDFDHGDTYGHIELEVAWRAIIERHAILRTSFDLINHVQKVEEHSNLDWQTVLACQPGLEPGDGDVSSLMYASIPQYQDIDVFKPAQTFRLISRPGHRSRLLWLTHHSQIDGWSMKVIMSDLFAILERRPLKPSISFGVLARTQGELIRKTTASGTDFWTRLLEPFLPPIRPQVYCDSLEDLAPQFTAGEARLGMTLQELQTKCDVLNVTSAAVLCASWAIVLSMYSNSTKVVFGIVLSGRTFPMPDVEHVVGPLVNTCPFPVDLETYSSKHDLLLALSRQLLQITDNQWTSASVMDCLTASDVGDIFHSAIALQYGLPEDSNEASSWTASASECPEFPLNILINDASSDVSFKVVQGSRLYSQSILTQISCHMRMAVLSLLDCANQALTDIDRYIFTPLERTRLTSCYGGDLLPGSGSQTLGTAFDRTAHHNGDVIAVQSLSRAISYRELDNMSQYIASQLSSGVFSGKTVGVLSDGSYAWVVCALAVAKLGAIYLPLDVTLPISRLRMMTTQAYTRLVLVPNYAARDIASAIGISIFDASAIIEKAAVHPRAHLSPTSTPEDIAYITFTSGSTGVPKGVPVTHRAIMTYLSYPPARVHAGPGSKVAQMYSVGFDASIGELFGTLCFGATLVLKDPADPLEHLSRSTSTMITPSMLALCSPSDLKNLKVIFCGGEVLPQRLADLWSSERLFYNAYGPAECTVGSLFALLRPGDLVSLGRPLPGMTVYILRNRKQLVPIGVTGEICLSGIQVSPGYLGVDSGEQDKFIPDPFCSGRRMYCTGDLGAWKDSLDIQFHGRADSQIKIRGFRIELEEVERAITAAHPGVSRSVVIVVDDNLFGFVSPSDLETEPILSSLRAMLPRYACPSELVAIDEFPLTANHKVDKGALCRLLPVTRPSAEALTTPMQETVAMAWIATLDAPKTLRLSPSDDFMAAGGSSLKQMKMARELSRLLSQRIPIYLVIQNPVLSDLSLCLEKHMLTSASLDHTNFDAKQTDQHPLSSLEQQMFFIHSASNEPSMMNAARLFEFRGNVDVARLKQAIVKVVEADPIFGTCYRITEGGSVYRCYMTTQFQLETFDVPVSGLENIADLNTIPFSLEKDRMIRIGWSVKDESFWLLFVIHHIIIDEFALQMLLRRIKKTYVRLSGLTEHNHSRPETAVANYTYADFAMSESQRHEIPSTTQLDAVSYWQRHLDGRVRTPFTHGKILTGLDKGSYLSCVMPGFSKVRPEMFIASAALVVRAVTGVDDFVLGTPIIDRSHPGTENMLGLFLDRMLVKAQFGDSDTTTAKSLLEAFETEYQEARAHFIPYKAIQTAVGTASHFDVMVSWHGPENSIDPYLQLPQASVREHRVVTKGAKFPLLFEFFELDAELRCDIQYNTHIITSLQAEEIVLALESTMTALSHGHLPQLEVNSKHLEPLEVVEVSPRKESPSTLNRPTLQTVRGVFAEVLKLEANEFDDTTGFYNLGGDSMGLMKVHKLLIAKGVSFGLGQIVRAQTVENITELPGCDLGQ